MANKLGSFAIVGLRNMTFIQNGEVFTNLKHLKDIDISNESPTTYLRGGEGNKRLLAITGDASATITSNQATMTTKLFEVITGNKLTKETKAVGVSEDLTVSVSKVTLKESPASGEQITVYTIDAHGRDDKKIVLGAPSTAPDTYSIADKVLTFHSATTGQVRVYYKVSKEVEVITSKPTTALNYRIEADMIVKDVDSKDVYLAKLIVPNGQIQENFSITGSNEATEPAAVPLAIDCLEDSATGKFYEILFYPDDRQA